MRPPTRRLDETISSGASSSAPDTSSSPPLPLAAHGFVDVSTAVELEAVLSALQLSRHQLAEAAGLQPRDLKASSSQISTEARQRIHEMLEIIGRLSPWAGGVPQALAWYRAEPIPALGGRPAEALVKTGQAAAVMRYLDHIATGGFA